MFINDNGVYDNMLDDRECHKIQCQFCKMVIDKRDKDFEAIKEAHDIYHMTHIMADGSPRNTQGEKPQYKPYYG